MDTKPTIAIFTSSEGHFSIAEAVQEALQPDYEVVTLHRDIPTEQLFLPIYRKAPWLFQVPYTIGKIPAIYKAFALNYGLLKRRGISTFLRKYQPLAVINTHFLFNSNLAAYKKRTGAPFLNIITDPRTIHPILLCSDSVNVTYDEAATNVCQQYDAKGSYSEMGWFVRGKFEQEYDQQAVQEKLRLKQSVFTILITSGSEGNERVKHIIPTLLASSLSAQIIVACGKNEQLLSEVKTLAKLAEGSSISIVPLPFTKELHLYMQAADLVVGKAGPNMIFESVATHTPFLAISHISGQESGNLDMIRELGIGFVEEDPDKAVLLLQSMIENPGQLTILKPALEKIAMYNRAAKTKILAYVRKSLEK